VRMRHSLRVPHLLCTGNKLRSGSGSDYRSEEDELEFYDCEDLEGAQGLTRSGRSRESFGNVTSAALSAELQRYYPSTAGAGAGAGAFIGVGDGRAQGFPVPGSHELDGTTSARDIAVTIVEAVFVMAEFTYWQVRTAFLVHGAACVDDGERPAAVLTRSVGGCSEVVAAMVLFD
jgi:hypothetical protein